MKTRLAAAALALMLAPGTLMAMCSAEEHAASCKEGHVWDGAKGECVAKPSS